MGLLIYSLFLFAAFFAFLSFIAATYEDGWIGFLRGL